MADWELNYLDREILRPQLIARIRQAVTKYLLYVAGGGGSPSQGRQQWAKDNLANVTSISEELSIYCMSEPTFVAGGTSITDAAIQSRVESVLQSDFMPS